MQENKKKMISLGLTTVALLLIVVGATYAYFAAQIDNGASTDVNITAESVDSLTFTTGDPISFSITQENLKQGGTDRGGSTTSTASLIAGKDLSASYNYYVYLNIANNEFEYTTEDKKPELILTVTGPNNTEVTAIDGLTYNNTLKGFDITSVDGLIKIANPTISTTSSISQSWTIEITFRNLDTNQSKNSDKMFNTSLVIQRDELETLANHIKKLYTTNGVNNLYLHDSNLANSAEDGSYRYSGTNPENYVCFGSDATTCENDNLYRIIGVFGNNVKLIKADYSLSSLLGTNGTYTQIASFRDTYKGKQENAHFYKYAINNYNIWNISDLNVVNLNNNYLKIIGQDWSKKIKENVWQVGGIDRYVASDLPLKDVYDYELGSKKAENNISYEEYDENWNTIIKYVPPKMKAKIGLMYLSDYLYAIPSSYWEDATISNYSNVSENNWLNLGWFEYPITRVSNNYTDIYRISESGVPAVLSNSALGCVRPTFYLLSDVTYKSGTGTEKNPYRINQ